VRRFEVAVARFAGAVDPDLGLDWLEVLARVGASRALDDEMVGAAVEKGERTLLELERGVLRRCGQEGSIGVLRDIRRGLISPQSTHLGLLLRKEGRPELERVDVLPRVELIEESQHVDGKGAAWL
jgi:hypothetical protein